jgi:putative sigma-54 modulation protein
MQVTVTFRHMDSSDALKNYAEEKTERLARFLTEPVEVHWVLSVEKIRHSADATVVAKGVKIKSHEVTEDLYSAIDSAIDSLEKQVRRHKEKLKNHKTGTDETVAAAAAFTAPAAGGRARIVETENVFVKPMSVEEASLQMDVVDTNFLVFTNSATNNVNVIYRRPDGNYGLIKATVD